MAGRGLPWKTWLVCQERWVAAMGRTPGWGPITGRPHEHDDVLAGSGAAPDEALRDQDAVALAMALTETEYTLVEELVVQRAQAQPVVDVVRSVKCPPAHMGGLKADWHCADPAVVPAEGALVLVRGQDHLPHPPVPLSARGRELSGFGLLQLQTDGFAQAPEQRPLDAGTGARPAAGRDARTALV